MPPRVSPLILHPQAESSIWCYYSRDSSCFPSRVHIICPQPSSDQSRVYWVTQLCADGIHCRESAGKGLEVLIKLVRVTDAAFSGFTMDQFIMRISGSRIYCISPGFRGSRKPLFCSIYTDLPYLVFAMVAPSSLLRGQKA